MRARELDAVRVPWMSMDPLWPDQQGFIYVVDNPLTLIDPYGLQVSCAPPASAAPIVVGSAPVCVIGLGIVACWELYTYQPGKPTGPFTGVGQWIGNKLFPDPIELPAPIKSPKPKTRPKRQPKRRPKQMPPDKTCEEHQDEWLMRPEPPIGFSCWECLQRCKLDGGNWPIDRSCDYWNR